MLTAHFGADWPVKIGLSAGGGIDRPDGGDYRGTGRIGAHLGYGLPRGWLAMDAYATWSMVLYPPFELPNPDFKADLTFGHRLNDRFTAIAQVQSGKAAGGDAYMKLAPSIAVILGRVQVSLGAVYGLQNDASRKVTLGVSTAF